MTEQEETRFNDLDGKIQTLKVDLEKRQKAEEALQRSAQMKSENLGGLPSGGSVSASEKRDLAKLSFTKLLRAAAGTERLDGLEAEMVQEARQEFGKGNLDYSDQAIQIPTVALREAPLFGQRALTVSSTSGSDTDTAKYTVPTLVGNYIDALRENVVLTRMGADMLDLTAELDMPAEDNVFLPTWKGETAQADTVVPTYGVREFRAKRLSGVLPVSKRALIQNSVGLEARLRNQILMGHAIALDKAGINGAGSTEPTGILNTVGIGSHALGTNGAVPGWADILKLEELVDVGNALMGNLGYITNPKMRATLKSTKVDEGSGRFIWDYFNNEINGYQAMTSNNVPGNLVKGSSGANCSAIIFGNYQDAAYAMFGGIEILWDPYTLSENGKGRFVLNVFNDFHVLRPKSFAVIKDALQTGASGSSS
jgi:HK97 family phage major capsid protein